LFSGLMAWKIRLGWNKKETNTLAYFDALLLTKKTDFTTMTFCLAPKLG
jgi:hypothetical protein